MQTLLERLKLIDYLTTELPIDKHAFVDRFRKNVDEGSIGFFKSSFDVFRSSKNQYKGTVTYDHFEIRRRRKFFDSNIGLATAAGTYTQKENHLLIESKINGFHKAFIPFLIMLPVFYLVSIISIFQADNLGNARWLFVIFVMVHASFMIGIPYLFMRRGVSRMKYDLERDFYFFTK